MKYLRECWSQSRAYRLLLILAIVYAILRLAIQIFLFADAMRPEAMAEGVQVSADLQQSYIASAQHFQARVDLYLKGSLEHVEAHYLYSPAFAFFFAPLLLLPLQTLLPLMVAIHLGVYGLLYIWWARILPPYWRHRASAPARMFWSAWLRVGYAASSSDDLTGPSARL